MIATVSRRIGLLTTGGTIMSVALDGERPRQTLPLASMVASAEPDGQRLFTRTDEVVRCDSCDMSPSEMVMLATRVRQLIADAEIDGVVVTHGSDTLEESAFVCDLLVAPHKSVVFTAALRSAGELGADGPLNLRAAHRVASDPRVGRLGVVVVANEDVHAAGWVQKFDSLRPSAFQSPGYGPVGAVLPGIVAVHGVPARVEAISLPTLDLPSVAILRAFTGMPPDLPRHIATACEARGLVIEGFGMGNLPAALLEPVRRLVSEGVVVVVASGSPSGGTHPVYGGGGVAALKAQGVLEGKTLTGRKARLLLMLALASDPSDAAAVFARHAARIAGEPECAPIYTVQPEGGSAA